MYTKLEFLYHGFLALLSLPFLWVKDKLFGFVPEEPLQRKNLEGYICVVTGTGGLWEEPSRDLCM